MEQKKLIAKRQKQLSKQAPKSTISTAPGKIEKREVKPKMVELRSGLDLPLKNKSNSAETEIMSLADSLRLLEEQKRAVQPESEAAVTNYIQNKQKKNKKSQMQSRGKRPSAKPGRRR